MALNPAVRRKVLVTGAVLAGLLAIYEVTLLDSKRAARKAADGVDKPVPGSRHSFAATAYCKGLTTASGVAVQKGAVAADPDVLPAGTIVQIDTPLNNHDGVYTVLDTGPKIQGRIVDIYMWSCHDALAFGRRQVALTVVRLGWDPRATAPTRRFFDRWLSRSGT